MDDLALATPLWLAALGLVVNALVGAMHGYLDDGRWDVVGVISFGLVMALGGGVLRDLLVGLPPQSLRSPWPVLIALGGVALARLITPWVVRVPRLVGSLDALALGLFAITGAAVADAHGLPAITAVLVGGVAAVGGGVLVSLLRGEVPAVLTPSRPQALLAVVVSAAYLLVARWDAGLAYVVSAALSVVLFLVADRTAVTTRPVAVVTAP
jgi:uncharacterized membrane protein YeiH